MSGGWTSRERLAFWVLTAIGCLLRLSGFDRLGIEHFDEGVYASNLWFDDAAGARYPLRHLYAPPLLPWLIEWSTILSGFARTAPFWAALVAGCATPPSVGWIARRWWGPSAGLAATAAAALSDVHAVFSRMALTDSLLTFALLWAVYHWGELLRKGGAGSVAAAAGWTAVAWWTKYNGWLPAAIGATAALLLGLFESRGRSERFVLAGRTLLAVGLAALAFFPVWWQLQEFGGYAEVAANHRKYLTGLAGWPDAALRQLANLRQLDAAWATMLGPAAALIVAGVCRAGSSGVERSRWVRWGVWAASWAAAAWSSGSAAVYGGLAAAGWLAASRMRLSRLAAGGPSTTLAIVWWGSLAVVTPLYTPYARLALPWLVASWLGAAWTIGRLVEDGGAEGGEGAFELAPVGRRLVPWVPVGVGLSALVLGGAPSGRPTFEPSAWQSHRETRRVAEELAAEVRAAAGDGAYGVLVYGEPALFYELRAAGLRNVSPVGSVAGAVEAIGRAEWPAWVVWGPHAEHDESVRGWLASRRAGESPRELPFTAPDVVLLDRRPPGESGGVGEGRRQAYRAVRLR